MPIAEESELPKWSLPSSTSNRPLTLLGAGDRARRIACLWACSGYNVNIQDPDREQCETALQFVHTNASSFAERLGRKTFQIGKCRAFTDLASAVSDAWLVIEACQRQQQSVVGTLSELDAALSNDCIFAIASSPSSLNIATSEMSVKRRNRICYMHYSFLPMNRAVELMPCRETDPAIIPFLAEQHRKMEMISSTNPVGSKGMVMDRIWAAVKREVMTVLAEGVSSAEEIDMLWKEMFSDPSLGPCAMMDMEGLEQVAEREDEYSREHHLDSTFTSEYLRWKYIQEGRLGHESPKGGLTRSKVANATLGRDSHLSEITQQPTLFFLDVGVGENVHSMEEAMTAGKILSTTPDSKQINTIITGQSYPDGIDISPQAKRIFWTNMGVTGVKDGSVMSANLDGTDIQSIIPKGLVHTPKQLAIDHQNSHLYFSDREGLSVHRCTFTGTNLETLIQTGDPTNPVHATDPLRFCIGVAVDPTNQQFYWTQKGPSKAGKGRIFRAAMTIPDHETPSTRTDIELLFCNLPECVDLDYDPSSQSLWWTDRGEHPGGNSLNVSYVGGHPGPANPALAVMPQRNILTRHLHEAIGIRLDARNRCVYVCDLGGSLYSVGMDGRGKRVVWRSEAAFTGVALVYLD